MFTKFFCRICLFVLSVLAVQLHAVQSTQKKERKNDSKVDKVAHEELKKERAYYEKVFKITKKHYGDTHPNTAKTLEDLGNVLVRLGAYASAKQGLAQALKIYEQHYGADHLKTMLYPISL